MQVLPASFRDDHSSKMAEWNEAFHASSLLRLEERIATLQSLVSFLSESDKSSELYGRVKRSLRAACSKKLEVDARLASQADYFVRLAGDSLPICIEHAVLDSRPDVPGSFGCLSEGMAIQFFLILLHYFDAKSNCGEINDLKRALEDLFALWLYLEDYRFPRSDRLEDGAQLFHNHVSDLLKRLQEGLPYLFFPLASSTHAMVGKVTWALDEGYSLTIINKGEWSQFYNGKTAADLMYRGLTKDEVLTAIMANIDVSHLTYIVYDNIERALPAEKRRHFMGRRHGVHKRPSCSIKSLAEAIHGVLPDWLYRSFKVFYTERLIAHMAPGVQYDAACEILKKRTIKSS